MSSVETPIIDFVRSYGESGFVRAHMPGHKGRGPIGPEALDITEIRGADELYGAEGIIKKSEEIASRLFGTGRTLYSAEGSSLCIRAMLLLALQNAKAAEKNGAPARRYTVLAGRNAHKTLMTAA
ncbi:MAG: amino acid decarboxylase, partial [Clostridia bacterium]|nr:amino acid decarboxylase [Clostridia bacterium]